MKIILKELHLLDSLVHSCSKDFYYSLYPIS